MFGKKVQNTRVFPVTLKIIFTFSLFILISNFTTNYINLIFNRAEQTKQMNQLLIKDLKDIYTFCNNQFEIFKYDKKLEESITNIENKGLHELKNKKAIVLGVKKNGEILFQASRIKKTKTFTDKSTLNKIISSLKKNKDEDHINFKFNNEKYFGIYKYSKSWDVFIFRAEEVDEFYSESRIIFWQISAIIILITIIMSIIGIYVLRFLLRYITHISASIMKMIESQKLSLIDLKGATNDDITFLGAAFNSLSSTVDNLISIFRKFANQDIVSKAYSERQVKLEGTKKELAILFSDIKSFTFITETLGTDIIKLLNMHYDNAIREIIEYNGVIGSIIGDALLAVYGVLDDSEENKSYQAVQSAYRLHEVTEQLRQRMTVIKENTERKQGKLNKDELKIYKAVLLEIGVGIDGGEVFYGTLGSYVRMTNTVIGDNVNAASRLEGLTRVYKVPVICSDYIKNDIEQNVDNHGIHFLEIDTVLVKGKTEGKKVYWPILEKDIDKKMENQLNQFHIGLLNYYQGNWKEAKNAFSKCKLSLADEFKQRTKEPRPKKWNGIWQMQTK